MSVKPNHWRHAASVMLNGVEHLGVELEACTSIESYPCHAAWILCCHTRWREQDRELNK